MNVFQSESGGPLCQANVLRRSLHEVLKNIGRQACGFHAFRRFRNTHLRKARVPDGLIQFWMGHGVSPLNKWVSGSTRLSR